MRPVRLALTPGEPAGIGPDRRQQIRLGLAIDLQKPDGFVVV